MREQAAHGPVDLRARHQQTGTVAAPRIVIEANHLQSGGTGCARQRPVAIFIKIECGGTVPAVCEFVPDQAELTVLVVTERHEQHVEWRSLAQIRERPRQIRPYPREVRLNADAEPSLANFEC